MVLRPASAAALWLAISAVFGVSVAGFFRVAVEGIDPLAMPFWRALLAVPLLLPWLLARDRAAPAAGFAPRAGFALHLARAAAVVANILFFVIAIRSMPIADATALVLVGPVFAVAFAALLFGERAGPKEWLAVALGFGGAVLVVGPRGEATLFGATFALLAAAAGAADWLLLKGIARHDGMWRATAWLTALMTPLALPLALAAWSWPPLPALLAVFGAALAGTLAQAFATRAFALGKLWHLTALNYLNVPLAAALGWFAFAETVAPWTLAGGAAIVAASVALAQIQARTGEEG
jgi:drug/metabolite transporter (DMT)-like permease